VFKTTNLHESYRSVAILPQQWSR